MIKKKHAVLPLLLMSLAHSSESAEVSTYIYNGTTATIDTFPSIATLYYDAIEYTGYYGLYCGATILDDQHVLTAAHCLYDGDGELDEEYLTYTSVAVQMEDESQFLDGSVDVIRASEFYVHSGYVDSSSTNSTSWPNDIAIIKLASSMNIDSTDYAERASSTESATYREETESFVAVGHGYTEDGDGEELLQTTLTYQSGENCDFDNISDSQLCMAGAEDEDTGVRNSTCSGDSGGPLYWDNGSGYVQAGITSYGWTNCYNADSDDTSVFTEVADYETWISSVLAGNEIAVYTVTDEDRDNYNSGGSFSGSYYSDDDDSESSSSGGGVALNMLLLLLALAAIRQTSCLTHSRKKISV